MALFKKQEQMSLEEILKAVETLSDADKAKIAEKVVVVDNEDAKPEGETEKQIDEAKEDISAESESKDQTEKDRIDESVGAQEKADSDEDSQDAKDRVDEEEGAEKAEDSEAKPEEEAADIDKAEHAEIESLRGDVATLQSQIADILAKLENLPMGAPGLGGVMNEDGNEWQGKAIKAYPFSR